MSNILTILVLSELNIQNFVKIQHVQKAYITKSLVYLSEFFKLLHDISFWYDFKVIL